MRRDRRNNKCQNVSQHSPRPNTPRPGELMQIGQNLPRIPKFFLVNFDGGSRSSLARVSSGSANSA